MLSDVLSVLTLDTSIAVLHALETLPFSESASCGKSIVAGVNWMQRVSQSSLTTCVLKNYFLDPSPPPPTTTVDDPTQNAKNTYTENLRSVFSACEQSGLRLCGLRTAYVSSPSSSQSSSSKSSTGAGRFIHGSVLTQPFSASSREDCHLVLVACFYTPR